MTTAATAITEESTRRTIPGPDGMTINYHDVGSGFPVIFLPSGGSRGVRSTAWMNFEKNIPLLSQSFRCIAMDLVNYGRTGPFIYNEPSHGVHARTLRFLMDHLGIEKAHIVGNSTGGTTALVFALDYPDRVGKIVVSACHASTGGDPYLLANRPAELSRWGNEAFDNPSLKSFRDCLEVTIWDKKLVTDELVSYLYHNFVDNPDHIEATKKQIVQPHSNLNELPKITAPVLVIHGRYDRMVPVEHGLTILNLLPNSRLVIFNKCGSLPPYEHPDEYNLQMLNHLNNVM